MRALGLDPVRRDVTPDGAVTVEQASDSWRVWRQPSGEVDLGTLGVVAEAWRVVPPHTRTRPRGAVLLGGRWLGVTVDRLGEVTSALADAGHLGLMPELLARYLPHPVVGDLPQNLVRNAVALREILPEGSPAVSVLSSWVPPAIAADGPSVTFLTFNLERPEPGHGWTVRFLGWRLQVRSELRGEVTVLASGVPHRQYQA